MLYKTCSFLQLPEIPSADAQSVAMPIVMQAVPRSIPASGTRFCEDLVMEIFYDHSFSSADSRRAGGCHLMAKECSLSTLWLG